MYGKAPHFESVALRYLVELGLFDAVLAGPVLLGDDVVTRIARVEIRARVREDRPLARTVDVVDVLVTAKQRVGLRDVLGTERHRDHPHCPWRVARPQIRVDEHRRPVVVFQDEPVTAQIPDRNTVRVRALDSVQQPRSPVARCHRTLSDADRCNSLPRSPESAG